MNKPEIRGNFLPYGTQSIGTDELDAIKKVFESGWITGGSEVDKFENEFRLFVNSKFAVACSSGTAALHLAMLALNIKQNDEVITTPYSFAATANCILYQGGRPIFVDINESRIQIDPSKIESKITNKTKAIISVDYAGLPSPLDELRKISERHNIPLVEDAAHAVGATYKGQKVGSCADLTIFSFHPVKQMTTGEGGMITTNNLELGRILKKLRNHGIDKTGAERFGEKGNWYYEMTDLGYNYRITDIQCAIGRVQLKKLPKFLERRQEIAQIYKEKLSDLPLILPPEDPDCYHTWHLYPIQLADSNLVKKRETIFSYLKEQKIGVNVHYIPIHLHPYYKKTFGYKYGDFPVSEKVFERIITIPLFPSMSNADIDYVSNHLHYIIEREK